MAAAKGNELWRLRKKHGREPTFASPEALWTACVEYFDWVEANPLYESKLIAYQGEGSEYQMPKRRAMTKQGLCVFLGIGLTTWDDWSKPDNPNGYSDVVATVNSIIWTQKFEGASAEQFNPNIIARELGLKESVDNNHRSEDGTMSPSKVDAEVVNALVDKLLD